MQKVLLDWIGFDSLSKLILALSQCGAMTQGLHFKPLSPLSLWDPETLGVNHDPLFCS